MNEEYEEAIDWMTSQIRGWIGNMLRDLDAQGMALPIEAVHHALQDLANEYERDDIEQFIHDLHKAIDNDELDK